MNTAARNKKIIKSALVKIFIFILVIIETYPIFWMLTAALKKPAEFVSKPAYALPDGFILSEFRRCMDQGKYGAVF